MSTPSDKDGSGSFSEIPVVRLKRIKVADIVRNRGIAIIHYNLPDKSALSMLCFKPIMHLQFPYISPPSLNLDLVWHAG